MPDGLVFQAKYFSPHLGIIKNSKRRNNVELNLHRHKTQQGKWINKIGATGMNLSEKIHQQ